MLLDPLWIGISLLIADAGMLDDAAVGFLYAIRLAHTQNDTEK